MAVKGSAGAAPTLPSAHKAARHLTSRVHWVLRSRCGGLMVCPREGEYSLADPGREQRGVGWGAV